MSRDLTKDEQKKFGDMYGTGAACENCGDAGVTVKIWEKHGTDAAQVGGDIGPSGIVGAIVACDVCDHAEIVPRSRILKSA